MTADNLYTLLCTELAKSGDLSEIYLVAGKKLEALGVPVSFSARIAELHASDGGDALDFFKREFHKSTLRFAPAFGDGVSGIVEAGGVPIEYSVRRISEAPETYRILFARVDSVKILTSVKQHLEAIEWRLRKLESADSTGLQVAS
jgi:hypothetical protein